MHRIFRSIMPSVEKIISIECEIQSNYWDLNIHLTALRNDGRGRVEERENGRGEVCDTWLPSCLWKLLFMLYTLLVISLRGRKENGENILQLIFNYENTKKKVVAIPCMQTQAQSRTGKHRHTHPLTPTHTSTWQHTADFLDLNEAVCLTACAQVLCAGV